MYYASFPQADQVAPLTFSKNNNLKTNKKTWNATVPQRQTKYYRNAVDVVAEWP